VGGDDLLWMSASARFAEGVAIRGGIPLCWPWFGASPDDVSWPQHGFARTRRFRLVSQRSDGQGTSVVLALEEPAAIPEWQGSASLEVEIRLSDCLWMELRTANTTDRDLLVGAGLHGYFAVSDSRHIAIPELTGLEYLDKPDAFARKRQTEAMSIEGEVDRVYLKPPRVVELIDPAHPRTVAIEAWGHTDLVVWNPGPQVAASLEDFDDDGYRRMVCIEPAIALDHRLRLAPGRTFAIGQTITASGAG
jgi:D-hexose-6-phosphate mutarotase